ncbi:sensor histidine kinase [Brevibacillus porteri]|uniref:sensor histidine kinase n=1 Tax=Brevibacillus porteri TaxID=2126350 RepID=UPI003D1978F5
MHRVATKLLITILGIMILGLVLLGTISYQIITLHYQSYTELALAQHASTFAQMLSVDFNRKTLQHIGEMEEKSSSTVLVFSPKGELLIDSKRLPDSLFNFVQNWIQGSPNQKAIQTVFEPDRLILAKSPIQRGQNLLGTVVVITKPTWLKDTLQSLQTMLLLAGLGSLLITSGFGLLLSRYIVRPIVNVINAIRHLDEGNYDVRVVLEGKDELSLLTRQVNQLAKSLSYYRSSRREFLSHVAHELRTPLTYVKGYATLIQNSEMTPNRASKLISIIRDQSDRLEQVVNDLMTLSRLDEGKITLRKERVAIRSLLERIIEEMTPRAEELGVKLSLTICPPVYFWVDPQRFHQILMNLIDNAIRYSQGEGTVLISVTKMLRESVIEVKDEGIGISEKELELIWERFYRVEKSRSRHTGGSGLGLSIVKHLVDLHGGKIQVQSSPNRGTSFRLHFPNRRSGSE